MDAYWIYSATLVKYICSQVTNPGMSPIPADRNSNNSLLSALPPDFDFDVNRANTCTALDACDVTKNRQTSQYASVNQKWESFFRKSTKEQL